MHLEEGLLLKVASAIAKNRALSALAAAGALASVGLAFLGWVLDQPTLKGFGSRTPIWPLTAVGFFALALAQLAQLYGRFAAALALFAIPVFLAVAGVVQGLSGHDPGIHSLLFGEELARVRSDQPSRAPYLVMLDWMLLIAAMLLARLQTWRSCLAACIVANIPLALSIMTVGLTIAGIHISTGPAYFLWASLPASIATLLLCLSVFLWCRAAMTSGRAAGEDAAGWTFVRVFPLVLLVPGLTWLLELVALSHGIGARALETTAVGLNVVLVAFILAWAMRRMSRQQAALRDFTSALDSTPIVLMDPDGTVSHWSRGCERLFGWTAAEALGEGKYSLLRTEFDGAQRDLWSLPPGGELKREVTDSTKGGDQLRVLEHVRRIDGGKDTPVLVVALTDVTEQTRREADLEARRALIRAILDTVPDAMMAFDTQGLVRRFSPGASKMLGYAPDEVLGKHFAMVAVEDQRTALTTHFERYLETGASRFVGRVTRTSVVAKDGSVVPVELRAVETVADGERLFIMFLRDLTEAIANEDRLATLAAELGHVARLSAMGEMAAGMAHELNQPLAAVANYTGAASLLMERSGDLSQAHELVGKAREQTLRAGQIILRMREFVSRGHVDIAPVTVAEMIEDAVALVFVGPMPVNIKIKRDLDPGAEIVVVDRIQIQQVLVNLLRNAVQVLYDEPSGRKEIEIASRWGGDGMVEISVSNTGPGIPKAAYAKLFEPFTPSSNKGGMGIGLSICRRIVEAHGGKIWAENRQDKGVVFRFTVPRSPAEEDVQE